ncbi:MAG: hypothetical protein IPH95_08415 [Candidatus Promineofilum sp.]|nr:hypothetical protein [Promineifilum sp.]
MAAQRLRQLPRARHPGRQQQPNLVLEATVKPGILGIGRHVEVRAFCSRHLIDVEKPEVGCPQCAAERPGLRELFGDL